jgi:hypothetical protein
MTCQQLVSSDYARCLVEAAATTLVVEENIHRDNGESAIDALVWAIDNGGLFTYEQVLPVLVDQALRIHQKSDIGRSIDRSLTRSGDQIQVQPPVAFDPFTFAECLPVGADEEDRILSLLCLTPS